MNGDKEVMTYTATRTEATSRTSGYLRFEVFKGCWVTIFDDGRTRFLMDETDRYEVAHKNKDSHRPGAKMIEHKMKG